MAEHSINTQRTSVHITGFGPFGSIKVNPSSSIGKSVATALQDHHLLPMVEFTELETSIEAVLNFFTQLDTKLGHELAADPNQKFLLLHLGVHSSEENGVLRAEVRGYNELFASVPDVRGVPLNHELIFPADGGVDAYLESWFDEEGSLQQAGLKRVIAHANDVLDSRRASEEERETHTGPDANRNGETPLMASHLLPQWVISYNAGRYICNCCLYYSLKLQEKYPGKVASIFLHVCDDKKGQRKGVPIVPSGPEDVKTESADEAQDMPILRYNPTLAEQSQQVELLALGLLDIMSKA